MFKSPTAVLALEIVTEALQRSDGITVSWLSSQGSVFLKDWVILFVYVNLPHACATPQWKVKSETGRLMLSQCGISVRVQ